MVGEDEGYGSDSSIEFVSATYATQPVSNTDKHKGARTTASIKNEILSQNRKSGSSNRLIIPDIRPIIRAPNSILSRNTGATGEQSVINSDDVPGVPDWLPSPPPSQSHQSEEDTQNPPSNSRSQGQASFAAAREPQAQPIPAHSLTQGNAALTRSPSGRPRPRPSASAIASSLSSPSKSRPSATQLSTRPKPRPSAEAILASTQSRQEPVAVNSLNAEEENVSVTGPTLNQESIDEDQPLAKSTEDTVLPRTNSILHAQEGASAPTSTIQLRPRRTKRKRASSVIIIDDSPSPTPPAEGPSDAEERQQEQPAVQQSGSEKVIPAQHDESVPVPPKRGRGRPRKDQSAGSKPTAAPKKKPSKPIARKKTFSKRGKNRLPTLAMLEREQFTSTAPSPRQSPEQPPQPSIPPPPRRHRRRSLTPVQHEEQQIPLFFPDDEPPVFSRRGSHASSSQHTFRPTQSQRPKARPRRMGWDDEPETHFQTAPVAPESSNGYEDGHEDGRVSNLTDSDPDQSGSTVMQNASETNSQDDNEHSHSPALQIAEQERESAFRPTQSQRPRARARQMYWDDEPESYFQTAPNASESSLGNEQGDDAEIVRDASLSVSEHDQGDIEDQEVRDITVPPSDHKQDGYEDQNATDVTVSDSEQGQSGSTVMRNASESNSQDENEQSPNSQAVEQEQEKDSSAKEIEDVADVTMTDGHAHDSQTVATIEEQVLETLEERAGSKIAAPTTEEAVLDQEERSSSSSPPHSSSPPSSASSYESALETQRRSQDSHETQKEAVPEDAQGRLVHPIGTREPAQSELSQRLFSTEPDGRPLRVLVPMAISERDLILELIRSNGARVCNRVEECEMVIVDDDLLESENNAVLTVIRHATKQKSRKSILRKAWLVDSIEAGKAVDRTDGKYAISKEIIESIKAKPSARLYNSVPNRDAKTLALMRSVPGIGGRTRIDFTEADAVQIIHHLAITNEAWDGTLCAKELQNRYKRHTWMSYQSHIRDNLNKNKHYGDRARDYQKKIGQEKRILERHKMQAELNGSGE